MRDALKEIWAALKEIWALCEEFDGLGDPIGDTAEVTIDHTGGFVLQVYRWEATNRPTIEPITYGEDPQTIIEALQALCEVYKEGTGLYRLAEAVEGRIQAQRGKP